MTMVYQCQWPHMHKCPSPLEPQGLSLPGWGWGSHNPETLLPGGGEEESGENKRKESSDRETNKGKGKGCIKIRNDRERKVATNNYGTEHLPTFSMGREMFISVKLTPSS